MNKTVNIFHAPLDSAAELLAPLLAPSEAIHSDC